MFSQFSKIENERLNGFVFLFDMIQLRCVLLRILGVGVEALFRFHEGIEPCLRDLGHENFTEVRIAEDF